MRDVIQHGPIPCPSSDLSSCSAVVEPCPLRQIPRARGQRTCVSSADDSAAQRAASSVAESGSSGRLTALSSASRSSVKICACSFPRVMRHIARPLIGRSERFARHADEHLVDSDALAGVARNAIAVGQVPKIAIDHPAMIDDDVAPLRKSLNGEQRAVGRAGACRPSSFRPPSSARGLRPPGRAASGGRARSDSQARSAASCRRLRSPRRPSL